MGGVVEGRVARQAQDGVLARGVLRDVGRGDVGVAGAEVDDAAAWGEEGGELACGVGWREGERGSRRTGLGKVVMRKMGGGEGREGGRKRAFVMIEMVGTHGRGCALVWTAWVARRGGWASGSASAWTRRACRAGCL